jgi:hypothetical protein
MASVTTCTIDTDRKDVSVSHIPSYGEKFVVSCRRGWDGGCVHLALALRTPLRHSQPQALSGLDTGYHGWFTSESQTGTAASQSCHHRPMQSRFLAPISGTTEGPCRTCEKMRGWAPRAAPPPPVSTGDQLHRSANRSPPEVISLLGFK